MKKLLLSAASLALFASAAAAADLPARKAEPLSPPPPPAPMWTGFYAGLNAGGAWGNSASLSTTGFPIYARPQSASTTIPVVTGVSTGLSGTQNLQTSVGFLGGGQVGYNFQYGKAVIGLETDFQGVAGGEQTALSTSRSFPYTYYSLSRDAYLNNNLLSRSSGQKALNYIGTVRAKIGYLVTPEILVYGTGGFAYGGTTLKSTTLVDDISDLTDDLGLGSSARSSLLAGWTAGGGVEWMFAQNWSAKVEYLYYDLGKIQMYGGSALQFRNSVGPFGSGTPQGELATAAGQNVSARFNGNLVRAGVNYHFNLGAVPVVAKF